jgi:hypothetical protein
MATIKRNIAFDVLSKQLNAIRTSINQLNTLIKDESMPFEIRSACRTLRDQQFRLLFATVHTKRDVIEGEAQVIENLVFGRERVEKFDSTLDDVSKVASTSRGILEKFTGKLGKCVPFKDKDELAAWMAANDPDEVGPRVTAGVMANNPDTIMTYLPQFVPRVIIALRLLTQVKTWLDRMLIIANLLMDFKVVKAIGKDIMRAIQTCFMSTWTEHYGEDSIPTMPTPSQDKEGRTTVEGEAQVEDLTKVVLAIAMIGGTIVYGHSPPKGAVDAAMKEFGDKMQNIGKIGNGLRGAFTIFDTVVKGMDIAVKAVADYVAPHWHPLTILAEKKEEIMEWMRKVSEVDTDHTRMAVTMNPEMRNDIFKLRDQGDVYFDWFNRMPRGGHQLITAAFLKSHTAIIKLSNEVAKAPLNVVAKTDPFCFCLFGEQGTGKSFLLPRIINKICDEYGIAVFRRIYPREMAEKYWSDYSHQFAVALDDFAQVTNPIMYDPYFEFIQLKSNVPKILPMADTNEKGRAFTSKLIGMTTNVDFPKPNTIAKVEALWRRRDMLIRVVKKGGVNVDMMTIDIGDTTYLDFYLMDSNIAGAPEMGPMSYDEMEALIVKRCIAHLERQKLIVKYLNASQLKQLERLYVSKGDVVTRHLIDDIGVRLTPEDFIEGEAQMDDIDDSEFGPSRWLLERAVAYECENCVCDDPKLSVCFCKCNGCLYNRLLVYEPEELYSAGDYQFVVNFKKNVLHQQVRYGKNKSFLDNTLWCAGKWFYVRNTDHYASAVRGNIEDYTTNYTQYIARVNQPQNFCRFGRRAPLSEYYRVLGSDLNFQVPWWSVTDFEMEFYYYKLVNFSRHIVDVNSVFNEANGSIAKAFREGLRVYRGNEPRAVNWDFDLSTLFSVKGEAETDEDPIVEDCGPNGDEEPHASTKGASKRGVSIQCTEDQCNAGDGSFGCWYLLNNEFDVYQRDHPSVDKHIWMLGAWEMWTEHEPYCKASVKKSIEILEKKREEQKLSYQVFDRVEKSFFSYIKEWWAKYVKWSEEHPYLNAIVKFVTLWAITYPFIRMLQPVVEDEAQNKEYHRGETRFRPMRRPVRGAPVHGVAEALHKEIDANASEIVKARVFPKIYRLTLLKGGEIAKYGQNCFHLYGRVILANKHFFNHAEVGDVLELRDMQGMTYEVPFMIENLWKSDQDDDLAGYFCDLFIPAGKDNRKMVLQDSDLGYLNRVPATVCFQDAEGDAFYYDAYARPMEHDVSLTQEKIMLRNGWYLDVNTAKGQCGGIMTIMNSRCPRKIAGMHCASVAKGTTAVSQLLTQELLEPLYKFMATKAINYITPPPLPALKCGEAEMASVPDFGNIEVVGILADRVPQGLGHHIVPSLVHDEIFLHETEPSVLSKNDERLCVDVDPMHKGIAKYGNVGKPYPQEDVNRAVEDLKRVVLSMKPDRKPRVLTEQEAINGCPLDHFDRLDMQTSPGYPYVKYRPPSESGKKWLFRNLKEEGEEPEYIIDDPLLRRRLDDRLRCAKKGQRIESQFSAQLKSERRPIEKIEQGKTRVFIMGPVDKTLADRMYFLDFCACLMKNRKRSFHSVGIDAGSSDWSELYWYLREMASEGFDGDHENFDGKFMTQWFRGILDVVNAFYNDGPTNALVRAVLIDEMIHKHVRVQNWLLYIHVGMPSGTAVTTIFNSCGNELEIKVVWLGLAKQSEPVKANLVDYHSNVRPNVFGDDNLMTVRKAVQHWFNGETYSQYLLRYGRVYTPAKKDDAHVKVRQLSNLRFLKRGFRVDPNISYRVYSPIENRTVRELLNWVTDRTDPEEQLILNYIDAQRFMFHEGYKSYSDFRTKCDPILRAHGLDIPPHDYRYFDAEFEASFGVPTS